MFETKNAGHLFHWMQSLFDCPLCWSCLVRGINENVILKVADRGCNQPSVLSVRDMKVDVSETQISSPSIRIPTRAFNGNWALNVLSIWDCVDRLHDTDQAASALKKAMNQVDGERDMAAQETAHLLQEPLYRCTYSFVPVSLDGNRRINHEDPTSEALDKSLINLYAQRAK